jgi:predicted dienelactone hydrolase
MVTVWYPAEAPAGAETVLYLPRFAAIEKCIGEKDMKDLLGISYARVKAGRIRTHSVENARIVSGHKTFPVLVFSPGFGEYSLTYTAVLEDLVSHGYVVAAIDHPYDTSCVVFPDGRAIPFAQAQFDATAKKPEGVVNYQIAQIPIRAADMHFVIDQLIRYDRTPELGAPFAGHLDLQRIGVFGHSVGGMGAARLCQIDPRVRAGMNQDADYDGIPFIVYTPGETIRTPFLFFASDHSLYVSPHIPPPTEAELASMKLTRGQYDALVQKYQKNQDDALARMPGGSYRVSVETPGFTHRSFMDLPLLKVCDDPAAAERNLRNLEIVIAYTRAFFDKTLKGIRPTMLDLPTDDPDVRVDRFHPPN